MPQLTTEVEQLQQRQCVICRYADQAKIVDEEPCCTNNAGPMIRDGFCYRYVSYGSDPHYSCKDCGKMVRRNAVSESVFVMRQCGLCFAMGQREVGEDRLQ